MQTVKERPHREIVLNIEKTTEINSKNHGIIKIYSVKPCERYSRFELMVLAANNPYLFVYNKELDVCYTHGYGKEFLEQDASLKSFMYFIGSCTKLSYYDACKKYLKGFAEIQLDKDAMYE